MQSPGIKGRPLKPNTDFIRKHFAKNQSSNIEEKEVKENIAENIKRPEKKNNTEEEFFKNVLKQDTGVLNSILKRKNKLKKEFEELENKKRELKKKKEILDEKHRELEKEDEQFKKEVEDFKNEEKETLSELTKEEDLLKNHLQYFQDESKLGKEISKKISQQPSKKVEDLDKVDLDNITSLLNKEKELHDKIQERLERRYSDLISQDMPGPANELFNYIRKHRDWLEKKTKELESNKWDDLDNFFEKMSSGFGGKKAAVSKNEEGTKNSSDKKKAKKTNKKKASEEKDSTSHLTQKSEEAVKELDSLINHIMRALANNDYRNARKLMKKAKDIYMNFGGSIIDKQRIYEELTELKKLMELKRTH